MSRIWIAALVAAGCGGAPAPASAPPAPAAAPAVDKMATFGAGGYLLAGAEYWPYVGSEDIDYPADVLWGFYPEKGVVPAGETDPNPDSARPEAIACAERAYAALRAFVASDPPKLRKIVELG